jgi:hypothetical protein
MDLTALFENLGTLLMTLFENVVLWLGPLLAALAMFAG